MISGQSGVDHVSRSDLLEEISDEMKDQLVIAKHNIDQEPNTPTKYVNKRDPNNAFI